MSDDGAMNGQDLALTAKISGNPCWGIWKRKVPQNYEPHERETDTWDTVAGDYEPDKDIVILRNRRTWAKTRLLQRFVHERFERVPVARDQGNSGW